MSPIVAQEKPDTKAYREGVVLFAAEKYKEAIESFKEATLSNPKNADAFYQLGTSHRMVEQFSEAIESYKQALSLKPRWADALYGLGVTYGMSGSPKDAVTYLKESISLKPDSWKAHYNLGVAYADLAQPTESTASFKEAARLNPKDADIFFNLGMSYQQLYKLKEAEDAYAQALLLKPNDAQATYQIALIYLAMGNRGFATIHYLSLQKSNPDLAQKLHDRMFEKADLTQKSVKGFGGHLIVVEKPQEFVQEWLKPETPNITPASLVKRDEPLGAFVLFAGCKRNSSDQCNSEVDYTVYKPDGNVYVERRGLELWKGQAPPAPNIQLSKAILFLKIGKDDPPGDYRVKAKVHDLNADIAFELETKFRLN